MCEPHFDNPQSEIRGSTGLTTGNPQSQFTDSPWFWTLVFSLMALLALAVIGFSGKYGKRQSMIELQYQARERTAEKITRENNPQAATRIDEQESRRPFATPGNNLITLWPLAFLLALVAFVSAMMLYRANCRDATNYQP